MTALGTERDKLETKTGDKNWRQKLGTEIIKVSSPKFLCIAPKECYLAHPIHNYVEVFKLQGGRGS